MQQGDVDGAIARLESIQDLNPNFPQTNYNLGVAYKEKQDLDKSAHYLERAISLKPDFYQAHIALSAVYEELVEKLIQQELENLKESKKDENLTVEDIEFTVEQNNKIAEYYKKAKIGLEEYIKYAPASEDKSSMESKIKEYEANIKSITVSRDSIHDSATSTNNEG